MATWDMFWEKAGKGFAEAHSKAVDRRARKEELEEERKIRAKELEDALRARREEATDERNWLLLQKDADRAYDELKKQDEARREVAGFDPKIREQVSQAPALIRSDAPSLPYGKDELGYDHPFKGSPDLVEDVVRSLKEEEGEVDWLAAAARGAQLQSVADDIRKRDADFAHAMKVKGYEATANRFASAGGNPKIVFDEIVEKDSIVPVEHQRAYFDAGRNAYYSKVSLSDRAMFEATAPNVMKEANKYKRYMTAMPTPKTFSSLNQLGEWQSKIDDAKLRSEIADLQRKVKVAPSGVKKMEDGALMTLPEKNLLSIRQIWNEAFDAQTFKKTIDQEEKQRAAWSRGTEAGAPKTTKPLPKSLKPIHGFNKADEMVVALVMNTEAGAPKPTAEDYNAWGNHFKIMGIDHTIKQDEIDNLYGVKEGLPNLNPPPQQEPKGRIFRNDAEIKAAISAGQLAVGDSYTYIDPRTGEEKIAILEEE